MPTEIEREKLKQALAAVLNAGGRLDEKRLDCETAENLVESGLVARTNSGRLVITAHGKIFAQSTPLISAAMANQPLCSLSRFFISRSFPCSSLGEAERQAPSCSAFRGKQALQPAAPTSR